MCEASQACTAPGSASRTGPELSAGEPHPLVQPTFHHFNAPTWVISQRNLDGSAIHHLWHGPCMAFVTNVGFEK